MRRLFAVLALFACFPCFASTLYVTEFKEIPPVTYQAAATPFVAQQTVAISGASTRSAAFNDATKLIRIQCDAICSVMIGTTTPTATTSSMRLIAGQTEYFRVTPGDKLAVIANT